MGSVSCRKAAPDELNLTINNNTMNNLAKRLMEAVNDERQASPEVRTANNERYARLSNEVNESALRAEALELNDTYPDFNRLKCTVWTIAAVEISDAVSKFTAQIVEQPMVVVDHLLRHLEAKISILIRGCIECIALDKERQAQSPN